MSAKVAIVAGAGALGHATAATLAGAGLTVVAVDRNEHALRELPDRVRREVADTTDPAVVTRLIDRIVGEVGPPDVLVNTIGAFRPGDVLATTPETLRLMIDVNVGPALWLSQAVAPQLLDTSANRGHVPEGGDGARGRARGDRRRDRLPCQRRRSAGERGNTSGVRRLT